MDSIYKGQLVAVEYETRQLKAIVIDPNGLGEGAPSIGLGMRMSKEYVGISQPALSKRLITTEGVEWLKLPSGKQLRVITIPGEDGSDYKVIEFGDWAELAEDFLDEALEGKSRLSLSVKREMLKFLKWFSVKGLYAASYTKLKGAYTQSDDNALTQSLQSANEQLIAENELLKLRHEREMNQLLYKLDAIEETNSASGTNWRHWELEQAPIDF